MEHGTEVRPAEDIVSLRTMLRERALTIPRGWLVVQSAAGAVQMLFATLRRPHGWVSFVLGGACLVLLALWSLAEQRLAEQRFADETPDASQGSRIAWRVVRRASAWLGVTTLFVFLSAVMSGMIGTWIS